MTKIPGPRHARQGVIAKAVREFGQSVRRQGTDEKDVGPISEINVQDRITDMIPTVPLVSGSWNIADTVESRHKENLK